MTLAPGDRIGPYEIIGTLGAGGMGEGYRGRDERLHRAVAIKVLPETLALDADRLARFQREAQLLASLNHPNIAAVHGFETSTRPGDAATVYALVMELVDGPTLADRIAEGAIAAAEALDIAKQIAEAVAAAHEQGIIHRDLKPANIKLRSDGTVPPLVATLLRSCLVKDRRQRVADMAAVLFVLDKAAAFTTLDALRSEPVSRRNVRWRVAAFGAAAIAVAVAATASLTWVLTRPEPPRVSRLTIAASGATQLVPQGTTRNVAIDPAGTHVVYRGNDGTELLVRDGQELFYRGPGGSVIAVSVQTAPGFDIKDSETLIRGAYFDGEGGIYGRTYDVSTDGRRFLMLERNRGDGEDDLAPAAPAIVVVQHLAQELKRLAPVK